MKAAQISRYGGPEVISINEVEQPGISENQVLVAVHAASLNPFDTSVRAGYMQESIPLQLPVTLGGDIAGEIVETGPAVSGFKPGDAIYGQANVVAGNSGAFAELAATKASQVAIAPKNVDAQQAAALPLVGVSALQAIAEHIIIKPEMKIFIHGGAGGIGQIAIQLAKHFGASVATTATGESIDTVKSLGADEVIDYKATDFSQTLKDFDAVFDTVGHDDFVKSYGILKPGGITVSMIAPVDEAEANRLGIRAMTQSTKVTTEKLDQLREFVESGVVTTHVAQVFPLDQVLQAFETREAGGVNGKIVLSIS